MTISRRPDGASPVRLAVTGVRHTLGVEGEPVGPLDDRGRTGSGGETGAFGPEWVENRRSDTRIPRIHIGELWRNRELASFLALRDLKVRYAQTVFGALWACGQPVGAALIFGLVFGRVVGVQSDGLPYPVFVYAGLIVWYYVSNSVSAAAESLARHPELITKVYFPRIIAPLAAVMPPLVDFTVALGVMALILVAYGVAPGIALLLLPLWVLWAVAVAAALGTLLAALTVVYRDVRHAQTFLLQLWFFVSPIVFPISLVGGGWRWVAALNPLVGVLEGLRWSLAGGPHPGSEIVASAAAGLLLAVVALAYFARSERRFADVV